MIAFLTGAVVQRGADFCLLDVGGVGYRLAMSTTSLAALPADGDTTTVLTHLHVRDDDVSLYGFAEVDERDLFSMLITVSGVGPKVALATLSALRPAVLTEAIAREDLAAISSVPGIGKKTAQRIVLDLKDRLDVPDLAPSVAAAPDAFAEAREALSGMGFSAGEITSAVVGFEPGDGVAVKAEEIVRHALQALGGPR
jgi:Holliday junction DNA helicase RuvA